jgi:hypothetical protein
MKKAAVIFTLYTVGISITFGQSMSDSISIQKGSGGYQFIQGGKSFNLNKISRVMKSNDLAYHQIQAAKSTYQYASFFGASGGFMIGWPIGTMLGGGEPNWTIAAVGAVFIAASIPIGDKYKEQAQRAIDTFNADLQTSSFWHETELRFSLTPIGAKLTLSF